MQASVTLTMSVTKLPKQRIKGFANCVVSIKVSKSTAILLVSRYIEVSSVSPSTSIDVAGDKLRLLAYRLLRRTAARPDSNAVYLASDEERRRAALIPPR